MGDDNINITNIELFEQLYADYTTNPRSLSASWQRFFKDLEAPPIKAAKNEKPIAVSTKQQESRTSVPISPAVHVEEIHIDSDFRVFTLFNAFRTHGHLLADVNPIATHPPRLADVRQLHINSHGFKKEDLSQKFPTCGLLDEDRAPLSDIIVTLQEIYCHKIGFEYMGLQSVEMEHWIQKHIEPSRAKPSLTIEQKQLIFQYLNKSELFETFLHAKYSGQKRFSIEGGETLIPILATIIETGAEQGLEEFIIGMTHRGRLSVLANIINKSYADIFTEFEESYIPECFEGSGDIKYHKGYSSDIITTSGKRVHVGLTANPSHLESVNPVVQGQTFARQVQRQDENKEKITAIAIHGDAAIAGQGIVYETMQMHSLPGYSTGGTIHIVINNQIGFRTLPRNSRSTRYCTDISHGFGAPVFHVNAEDPEGCIYASNLAVELRQKFHCDVFIELNCYRKWGHNDNDEPSFTQPLESKLINTKKPIREIYRDELIRQGVVEKFMAQKLEQEYKDALQRELKGNKTFASSAPESSSSKIQHKEAIEAEEQLFKSIQTGVDAKTLIRASEHFCRIPKGFAINKKLERVITNRFSMIHTPSSEKVIDWGMAEHLSLASLLMDGTHVRISGEDSLHGSFSHRHAMWVDQNTSHPYFPLKHLADGQGLFSIYDSPLSEYGVLGFEYGYSNAYPKALVIWEAQFGDFSNCAQVIIDQFITTGEQKWKKRCNLIMMLPHSYEGQGPEHSSARIERFLQLASNFNMQIVYPTTPAQFFHLLRRQALKPIVKPLVIFTPKGLLRNPECVSSLNDITDGTFQEFLEDPTAARSPKRMIICSGKIYYDLIRERESLNVQDIAIVRIEQLYPFNSKKFSSILKKYKNIKEYIWVQEEPKNMGAWEFIRPILQKELPKKTKLLYIGRERSASPAAGSFARHQKEFSAIIKAIFESGQEQKLSDFPITHGVRG